MYSLTMYYAEYILTKHPVLIDFVSIGIIKHAQNNRIPLKCFFNK